MNARTAYKLIAIIMILGSSAIFGQNASITNAPASIDAKVKRGVSYAQTFTVSNNTGTRLRLRCSLLDSWYDENNNRITGRAGTLPRSASLRIRAIATPPQTAEGCHIAVSKFEALPAEAPEQKANGASSASIGIKSRALMLFTTEDGAEYDLEVASGKIEPPTPSSELKFGLILGSRETEQIRVCGSCAIPESTRKPAGRGINDKKRPARRDTIRCGWAGFPTNGAYVGVETGRYNRIDADPVSLIFELAFVVW